MYSRGTTFKIELSPYGSYVKTEVWSPYYGLVFLMKWSDASEGPGFIPLFGHITMSFSLFLRSLSMWSLFLSFVPSSILPFPSLSIAAEQWHTQLWLKYAVNYIKALVISNLISHSINYVTSFATPENDTLNSDLCPF